MKLPEKMNFSSADKACLVLFACAFLLFVYSCVNNNTKDGAAWLIAAFGCAIMLYARKRKGK